MKKGKKRYRLPPEGVIHLGSVPLPSEEVYSIHSGSSTSIRSEKPLSNHLVANSGVCKTFMTGGDRFWRVSIVNVTPILRNSCFFLGHNIFY